MLSRPGSLFNVHKGLKTQSRNYSAPVIKETTLPNGLRVVSVDRASPITSLSLFVKAGSRYETRGTSGSSHFLKYFAGQNNSKKSGLRLVRDLEHYGSTMQVDFDREFIGYHIVLTTFDNIEIQIAAESLRFFLSPLLQEYEVDRIRELVRNDTRALGETARLLEAAHFTGFRDQGLGQPLYATEQALDNIDNRHLHRHLTENFRAGNISIVGTGLEHSKLSGVVEKLFSNIENTGAYPELDALEPLASEAATPQTVNWTGGEVREPGPGGARVLLAHKAPGRNNPREGFANYLASVHLNSLHHEGVCSTEARFIHYADAGLFAYAGSSPEGTAGNTLSKLSSSLKKLGSLSQAELDLAKQAGLTQHLHRITNTNALARHVHYFGRADSANEIKAVTLNDVTAAFSRLTDAQAVVVASGDVRGVNRM